MKYKVLRAMVAAGAVTVSGLGLVGHPASAGDAHGPACSDWSGTAEVSYGISRQTGQAIVRVANATLAAPSCESWDYNLYVLDAAGATLLASSSRPGDGEKAITLSTPVPGNPLPPQKVCIYTTTSHNGRVSDTAPDGGCVVLDLDLTGGPARVWN